MEIICEVYSILREMIRTDFEHLNLLMYGSTANGLLDMSRNKKGSDLDLTVINENFLELKDTDHLTKIKKVII